MKCESCNISEIEVEQIVDEGRSPYRLCYSCQHRLVNKSLRPLEFFNLVSVHGHDYYLNDDFYDYETGIATQPYIKVSNSDKYPFPKIEEIKHDLKQLVNYACVQYFISEEVIKLLKLHDKTQILNYLDVKVKYNRSINYRVYDIAAKILGSTAENWIRTEWGNRKENEVLIFADAVCSCIPFEEAFSLLTDEIEASANNRFMDHSLALIYFRSAKTLDWIEGISGRITNVSERWGMLAAGSKFTWEKAEKWLALGRPLSLIALDALIYCTTTGDRQNESFWLQRHPPKLMDKKESAIIANRLSNYLIHDNVHRTKGAVAKIISNIFKISNE